jgi:spermidine synthase
MDALFPILLWIAVIGVIIYVLLGTRESSGERWVPVLFFVSGFPALIYQVVWQRALFLVFGVNVESVTAVVTAFIFGLGVGGLLGGWISRSRASPLAVFAMCELGIAAFGAISLPLFHWVARYVTPLSSFQTGLLALLLIVLPTTLMGSTLPLLVSYAVGHGASVGRSVGRFYFVNTLGSAIACFLSAELLMRSLGQRRSVWLASGANAAVGLFALYKGRGLGRPSPLSGPAAAREMPRPRPLRYSFALALAGLTGFISLSYEILWYRIYAFTSGDLAPVFALLLGAYLLGIASGSLITEWFCGREQSGHRLGTAWVGWTVVVANGIAFMVVPALAYSIRWTGLWPPFLLVTLAAACLGAAFPLIAHLSIDPGAATGWRVGGLYFANIVGSAAGSIGTGFVLAQVLPASQLAYVIAMVGLGCGAIILATHRRPIVPIALWACMAAILLPTSRALFSHAFERLLFKEQYRSQSFSDLVENRNGTIAVADGTVFGDGVYDGRFNVELADDTNAIFRCYAVSLFHHAPRQVLSIGLSSGSWAQVLVHHPQVEHLAIVEINPAYLPLIEKHSMVSSLLDDPRVDISIDDGRRWLHRHPEANFDLIVMNTSFSWRAHASNLLSVEFLQLIRQHLRPGGVLFYNTTSSPEAQLTGVTVYPYGLRVGNFLAVSDSPIMLDREHLRSTLLQYRVNGHPVLDMERPEQRALLEVMLSLSTPVTEGEEKNFVTTELADSIRRRYRGRRLITDDNMGNEW